MIRCHGMIINPNNQNYGKRCSLFGFDGDVFCKYHIQQTNDKNICVARIKEYLNDTESAKGRENKLKVVDNMYTFITKNLGFVNDNNKFKIMAIKKLRELKDEEHWSDADKYLNIITKN